MLELEKVSRLFGDKIAVEDLSFELKKGEILGFIGANGSGKTTTMKMIAGVLETSKGVIRINGKDIDQNPHISKSLVGYLPERSPLYLDMNALSFLNFIGKIYKMKNLQSEIEEVLKICQLEEIKKQKILTLSKGYRQRISLASIILQKPDIFILDEPSDGLDLKQKTIIYSLFKSISKEKAVLLSSHNINEIESLCSQIIII